MKNYTSDAQLVGFLLLMAVVGMLTGYTLGWAITTTTFGHESCWFEERKSGERVIECARSGLPKEHEVDTFPRNSPKLPQRPE